MTMPIESGSWSDAMRDARRERIVNAAAQVFAEHGLDGGSVRAIAKAAGCTTGAIFPLFKNKEEIYAELLQRSLRQIRNEVTSAVEGLPSPAERVRARAFAILEYYLAHPAEFSLGFYLSAGLKRKGVGRALNEKLNDQLSGLARVGESDMEACVGSDRAALEGSALFAHITGLLVMELRGRFNVYAGDSRRLLSRYLDTLLTHSESKGDDHE